METGMIYSEIKTKSQNAVKKKPCGTEGSRHWNSQLWNCTVKFAIGQPPA